MSLFSSLSLFSDPLFIFQKCKGHKLLSKLIEALSAERVFFGRSVPEFPRLIYISERKLFGEFLKISSVHHCEIIMKKIQ